MRFIHTSDWHLGQTFHGFERTYEHSCFLKWLIDTLASENADVLLVCGDIFENPNPSAEARRMLYRFISEVRGHLPHLQMVFIAGNHDSPARIEEPVPLLDVFHTRAIGLISRDNAGKLDTSRLIVPLERRDGSVGAWCLAVPFLRAADVMRLEGATDSYVTGVAALYQRATSDAASRVLKGQAIVAMGHLHMTGGEISPDSERPIVIGGSEAVPETIFGKSIAYGALGHLHLAQTVAGKETLRYSGSPIPLSFSEVAYHHQIVSVVLQDGEANEITPIHIPRFVTLMRLPQEPLPPAKVLDALRALKLPNLPEEQQPYLEVRVCLDAPEPGLRADIEKALQGKPARLAKITVTTNRSATSTAISLDDSGGFTPERVFRSLYDSRYHTAVPDDLINAFTELLRDVETQDA